jgi:cyclohexanone monooxygenase
VSNKYLSDFIANKIRERVKDPAIAEKLIPKDHAFGTRRVQMETNYYEVYNKDNVHLVDIKESPITEITESGIQTADQHYEFDVIIYATGFNAVTGALDSIDIYGSEGKKLKDVWAEGPVTYLGIQIAGFPNLFTLVGAHNGAAFCNIGVCGGLQVEWVSNFIKYLDEHGYCRCEPETEAQEQWTEKVYRDYSMTLLAESDAWWVKVTKGLDGSIKRRALIYVGDAPEYRAYCEDIAAQGYIGFAKS